MEIYNNLIKRKDLLLLPIKNYFYIQYRKRIIKYIIIIVLKKYIVNNKLVITNTWLISFLNGSIIIFDTFT